MKPESIVIISFGYFEDKFQFNFCAEVEQEFGTPVFPREGHLDLSEFFDPARKQYDANKLLKEIDARFATDNQKTLAVCNVDLFIPILTFIFGQAFLNGRCGIASSYRLRNERYGLKPDDKILSDRLRKEIIHELGHTFGLYHCTNPICVMRSSTYAEDIDQKGWRFCAKCRKELDKDEG
ncbi:MAG: peptidase [Prolixibacteraceae bacterium]|nr:MAG: peptidase [Prolixibacteraceae bacterium]